MTQPASTNQTVTDTLDCTGLLCPLPVYKAAQALGRLSAGDVLELTTTDPGALADIPAMARRRGDTLLSVAEGTDTQVFRIQKGTTT